MKNELYFDMDGVLYPLNQVIINQYNKDYNDNFDWRENKKFNWQDTTAPSNYFRNLLNSQGTFIKGKPYQQILKYVNKLYNEGFIIKVITFPLWNNYCVNEKIEFMKLYFPWFNPDTDFIATGSKWLLAKNNRILIDDNFENLNLWKEHGGISIPFEQNAKLDNKFNSIKQVYNTIHLLEKREI